ncbi:MAG TPA: fructosamine kinase family protein, partial [Salinimicrobium sp.]|nr:fructosamine kinase family protein [Salinimicrobium sp.]
MPNKIEEILREIAASEGFEVLNRSSLAGGSINHVFLLETSAEKMVVKLNEADKFPGMFQAEKEG